MNRILSICLLLQGSAALADKMADKAAEKPAAAVAEKAPVTATFSGTFVSAEDNGSGTSVNLKDKSGKAFEVLLDPGMAPFEKPAAGANVEVVYRVDTFDRVTSVKLAGKGAKAGKDEVVGRLDKVTNGDMGQYIDLLVDGQKDPKNMLCDFDAVPEKSQAKLLHKMVIAKTKSETKNWYVSHKVLGAAAKAP